MRGSDHQQYEEARWRREQQRPDDDETSANNLRKIEHLRRPPGASGELPGTPEGLREPPKPSIFLENQRKPEKKPKHLRKPPKASSSPAEVPRDLPALLGGLRRGRRRRPTSGPAGPGRPASPTTGLRLRSSFPRPLLPIPPPGGRLGVGLHVGAPGGTKSRSVVAYVGQRDMAARGPCPPRARALTAPSS